MATQDILKNLRVIIFLHRKNWQRGFFSNAYCKIVIRHAAIDIAVRLRKQWEIAARYGQTRGPAGRHIIPGDGGIIVARIDGAELGIGRLVKHHDCSTPFPLLAGSCACTG